MEDGQRKLGRGADTRTENKQNNTAPQPPVRGGSRAGKTGRGLKLWGLPRGIRPGGRPGLPPKLLPVPPGASPRSRLPSPHCGRLSSPDIRSALISGHSAGSLGEEGTEGRPEPQQEGEAWPPGAAPRGLLPAQPLPQPHRHRQACGAPRVPGTAPHPESRFRTPATESDAGARFACDLHTSATPPHPNSRRCQVKGCETK